MSDTERSYEPGFDFSQMRKEMEMQGISESDIKRVIRQVDKHILSNISVKPEVERRHDASLTHDLGVAMMITELIHGSFYIRWYALIAGAGTFFFASITR